MSKTSGQARGYLDARLARLRLVVEEPRPHRGWIRAIRDALGMSSTELASRMAVGQSTICDLERSEVRDTIKLDSLRRAADALECDLIYFLVPRTTLDTTVRAQARHKARQHLASAAHILRNKGTGQDVTDDVDAAELDELVLHFADRRGLWSESSAPR